MRLATFSEVFWELRSGEKSHEESPETFWIPPKGERNNLMRGDGAKLIFEIEGEDESCNISYEVERMWVIVSEKIDDVYIGILDNKPASIEPLESAYLVFGAEIPFKAEHIIDLREVPSDYAEWQLSQPPERIWIGRDK